MLSVVQKSAIAYVERAEKVLGYVPGKKASKALDKGALEFAIGLMFGMGGVSHEEAPAAQVFAQLVAIRGFSWVAEVAKAAVELEVEWKALEAKKAAAPCHS